MLPLLNVYGWDGGIRTPDSGFRVHGLTAWRHPSKKVRLLYSLTLYLQILFFYEWTDHYIACI